MTTCQYYLKRTKNPRICGKKSSHTKSSFLGGVCPTQIPEFELHLCFNHFGMVADQIKKKIGASSFFDFRYGDALFYTHSAWSASSSQEWKFAQLVSILTQRVDEFNRIIQATHSPESFAVSSVPGADDVVFIEEESEVEVLARKFEEAKRDGRYIDLTELTEQKSVPVEHQIDCPICFDKNSPQNVTFLQCAHPVCNDCLMNIESRNIAQQCPVCRVPF